MTREIPGGGYPAPYLDLTGGSWHDRTPASRPVGHHRHRQHRPGGIPAGPAIAPSLCGTPTETEQVLAVARETGTLLWEAFVFLFHGQFERVAALVADGAIGELREIQSTFHFGAGMAPSGVIT